MVENYLIFNGTNTKDYGVYISGAKTYRTAERDRELIEIPGRNGYLLQDNGRYKPVEIEYDAFCVKNIKGNVRALINSLAEDHSIHELTDTFDRSHTRQATFDTQIDPELFAMKTARFLLRFTCQPERWRQDGQTAITVTDGMNLDNPTKQTAKPLVRIYGTGNLYIGEHTVTVTENSGYIDLDTEQGDAFEEVASVIVYRNNQIILPDHQMPTLEPGTTTIHFDPTITRVQIIPRWWEL